MSLKHKTLIPRKEDVEQNWFIIDGAGKTVGRLAVLVAERLRGKNLPTFTPHVNPNVHVIVTNATQLVFTGNKMRVKPYYRHSGYPGGLKDTTAEKLQQKKPGEILRIAVKGMLPHNRLGNALMKNLRIFPGPEHTHTSQQPQALEVPTR